MTDIWTRRRAVLLAATTLAPRRARAGADLLQLAQIAELTGPLATYGDAWRNGVELAVQQINAAGGLAGRLLQVTTFDAQSTSAGGHAAMLRALEGEPLAVLGPALSEPARGALAVARPNRTPLILGGGAGDLTSPAHPCTWRAAPAAPLLMARLCGWLRAELKVQRLAVLAAASEPFRTSRDALLHEAHAHGLEIVGDAGATGDLVAELAHMLHAAVDVLVVLLPEDAAGRAAAQAHRLAPNVALVGDATLIHPHALAQAGAAAERLRAHVVLADDPAAPALAAFRARYLARNKAPADAGAMAGFVALGLVKAGLDALGTRDPRDLCDPLRGLAAHVEQQPMLLLDSAWSPTGDLQRASWIVGIRDGTPQVIATLRDS